MKKTNTNDKRIRAIRLELEEDVVDAFENVSGKLGKPKTKIVRNFIGNISSGKFEMALLPENMDLLQSKSEACWDLLNAPGCWLEVDTFLENQPAFITKTVTMEPMVHIKYPTYRIDIIPKDEENNEKTIESLLEGIIDVSNVMNGSVFYTALNEEIKGASSYNVTCFALDLNENRKTKDAIMQRLNKKFICLDSCAYCIRSSAIEFFDDIFKLFKLK